MQFLLLLCCGVLFAAFGFLNYRSCRDSAAQLLDRLKQNH